MSRFHTIYDTKGVRCCVYLLSFCVGQCIVCYSIYCF